MLKFIADGLNVAVISRAVSAFISPSPNGDFEVRGNFVLEIQNARGTVIAREEMSLPDLVRLERALGGLITEASKEHEMLGSPSAWMCR